MSLSPRQLHGAVGSILATAAENGWVRTKPSDRLDTSLVRFVMFPTLQAMDEVQLTPDSIENVEVAQKISMRVGRHGVRGWSLTAIETNSVTYIDQIPPQQLLLAGRETAFTTASGSKTAPAATRRVISKLSWGKEGVDSSIRYAKIICDGLPEYENDIAAEIDALEHYDADMIPHEIDRVSLSDLDIFTLFSTAHEHAQQVMLAPEERAKQFVDQWVRGNDNSLPNRRTL